MPTIRWFFFSKFRGIYPILFFHSSADGHLNCFTFGLLWVMLLWVAICRFCVDILLLEIFSCFVSSWGSQCRDSSDTAWTSGMVRGEEGSSEAKWVLSGKSPQGSRATHETWGWNFEPRMFEEWREFRPTALKCGQSDPPASSVGEEWCYYSILWPPAGTSEDELVNVGCSVLFDCCPSLRQLFCRAEGSSIYQKGQEMQLVVTVLEMTATLCLVRTQLISSRLGRDYWMLETLRAVKVWGLDRYLEKGSPWREPVLWWGNFEAVSFRAGILVLPISLELLNWNSNDDLSKLWWGWTMTAVVKNLSEWLTYCGLFVIINFLCHLPTHCWLLREIRVEDQPAL